MRIETKIYTYKRPNGHNEFNEYLQTLPSPAVENIKTVIQKIEEYGNLVALKHQWISQIKRANNLLELRARYLNNQYRAFLMPIHQQADYLILSGYTKKEMALNNQKLDQMDVLQKEALNHLDDQHLEGVIYPTTTIEKPIETDNKPLPILSQNILNHLYSHYGHQSINDLEQTLHLKINSLQTLLEWPALNVLPHLHEMLKCDYNILFEYQPDRHLIPRNPIERQIKIIAKQQHKNYIFILKDLGLLNFDIFHNQINLQILYKIIMNEKIDFNKILNPIIQDKTTQPNTKPIVKLKLNIKYLSNTIKSIEPILSHFNKNLGLPYNAVNAALQSRTLPILMDLSNQLNASPDQILNPKIPEMPLNQQFKYIKDRNQSQNPLLQYLKENQIDSETIEKELQKSKLNINIVNNNNAITIIVLAHLFETSLTNLLTGFYDYQIANQNYQKLIHHAKPIDPVIKQPEQADSNKPIQSEVIPNEPAMDSSITNSRLQRLFQSIQKLDTNQILILNDLVNSWRK